MIYLAALFLGLMTGLMLRGRMSNLLCFRIKKAGLLVTVFAVQLLSQVLSLQRFDIAERLSPIINLMVFCIIFVVIWFNRKYFGMIIIGAGTFLNAAVMAMNGGKMPVSRELLMKEQLYEVMEIYRVGGDGKHILSGEDTRLAFLGDMIGIPFDFGNMAKFVSIGDLVIVLGLYLLIVQVMLDKSVPELAREPETEAGRQEKIK